MLCSTGSLSSGAGCAVTGCPPQGLHISGRNQCPRPRKNAWYLQNYRTRKPCLESRRSREPAGLISLSERAMACMSGAALRLLDNCRIFLPTASVFIGLSKISMTDAGKLLCPPARPLKEAPAGSPNLFTGVRKMTMDSSIIGNKGKGLSQCEQLPCSHSQANWMYCTPMRHHVSLQAASRSACMT